MAEESAYIILDPATVTYGAQVEVGEEGGRVRVDSSDGTATCFAYAGDDWFGYEVRNIATTEEVGLYIIIYADSVNSSDFVRTASLYVQNGEGGYAALTVRQLGMANYVEVDPGVFIVSSDAYTTDNITVTSTDGTWHIDNDSVPDWIMAYIEAGSPVFFLVVAANGTYDTRTASIRIYNDQGAETYLQVVQEGLVPAEWKPVHAGEFLDIKGNTWRAEILRNTADMVDTGELAFPADQPLLIEWESAGFEDAVWGSSATLKIISPGDRTYIDLYTVEPGTIRLDIYREGELYWSGLLDPEFYEEPYEKASGYEVSLTFTDFGILDRLKYTLEGTRTLRDIILHAVGQSGLNVGDTDFEPLVGLRFGDGSPVFGEGGLAVRSDNFTDEEGEPSTLREVLDGVLQPLGVRMAQRGGRIRLYDLEGMKEALTGAETPVEWAGDSQTLGVDKVYNSVTVTFSPYAKSAMLEDALSYGSNYGTDYINTGDYDDGDTSDPKYWTFFPDTTGGGAQGNHDYDFTLFLSKEGEGVTFGNDAPLPQYSYILPFYGSADECACIPYLFTPLGDLLRRRGAVPYHSLTHRDRWITLPRVYIPCADSRSCVRFALELLLDCRYNPFSGATDDNYSEAQEERLEKSSAFVFLPAWVTLYDSERGGNALCHYANSSIAYGGVTWRTGAAGLWEDGAAEFGDCWLEWYNAEDLTDDAGGVGGWKGNRHCIGMPDGGDGQSRITATKTSAQLIHCDDGEYIPFPPQGGWLEIAVGDDFAGYRYGSGYSLDDRTCPDSWGDESVRGSLRWALLRNPEISVVRNSLFFEDSDLDDVEYRGTLDEAALDDLSINTVCGTAEGAAPTAKGVYYRMSDGTQVQSLSRGGVADRPEKLLIGQLCAQHAERKATLTGEAEISGGVDLYTEANQEGKRFVLMSDRQDIRAATTEAEYRELGEVEYADGIYEYERKDRTPRPRSEWLRYTGGNK